MNLKVKGLDHELFMILFTKLNPNFTEEGGYEIENFIYDIKDFEISCFGLDNQKHVYSFSKEEEDYVVEEILKESFDLENISSLEEKINILEESNTSLMEKFSALEESFTAAESVTLAQQTELETAKSTIASYEAAAKTQEEEAKKSLIKTYEKVLSAEEIASIRGTAANFSYKELEGTLALTHSRKNLPAEGSKVYVPDADESVQELRDLLNKHKR